MSDAAGFPGSEGVSMGTSIMAVTYNGGVILGADSRTSTGTYIANRTADKVRLLDAWALPCRGSGPRRGSMHGSHERVISPTMQITPLADKVYVLRSGSASDTQAISSYVQLCRWHDRPCMRHACELDPCSARCSGTRARPMHHRPCHGRRPALETRPDSPCPAPPRCAPAPSPQTSCSTNRRRTSRSA